MRATRSCAWPTCRRTAQAVELELPEFDGRAPVELTGGTPFPAIGSCPIC